MAQSSPKVNKEAIKTLVVAYGPREAARRSGLNEDTVCAWAARKGWKQIRKIPQAICKQDPADALASTLLQDSEATRIGFSIASRKAAESLAERSAGYLLDKDTAQAAKHWHGVAAGTHGWEAKSEQPAVMVNVAILGVDPDSVRISDSEQP